jgi:hypothetical protein
MENPEAIRASFEDQSIEDLARQTKVLFDIQDREYGIPPKRYRRCFVGREAVAALVEAGIGGDVADAIHIGNMLLEAGVFHHVQQAHPYLIRRTWKPAGSLLWMTKTPAFWISSTPRPGSTRLPSRSITWW